MFFAGMVANVSSDGIADSKDHVAGTVTFAQVSPGSSVFVAREALFHSSFNSHILASDYPS